MTAIATELATARNTRHTTTTTQPASCRRNTYHSHNTKLYQTYTPSPSQ